jgi:hypothetical protein
MKWCCQRRYNFYSCSQLLRGIWSRQGCPYICHLICCLDIHKWRISISALHGVSTPSSFAAIYAIHITIAKASLPNILIKTGIFRCSFAAMYAVHITVAKASLPNILIKTGTLRYSFAAYTIRPMQVTQILDQRIYSILGLTILASNLCL